ncbi:hypothetical protein SAMN05421690_102029 [Nitrosomonas sp. Nm51]|uniref:hypothetical protein n=1 Tax=Nitrosomonas sp. Nm51 TaxID=133720 RepID=UPI0008AEB506|nr:hypothetical protein [Nitrosomonas sp. Nm51]SER34393.1 hypothetical protein SAMN05421690_102029 [Nitrosomonas sp. Nm51]
MIKCKHCLLPAEAPDADIDSAGMCAFCRNKSNQSSTDEYDEPPFNRTADLEQALTRRKNDGTYDALVCLSGGKDSLYLLHQLKTKYRLNVLAFTTDVNIPDIAWANIQRALKKLDIDHLVYRPSDQFYRKLFRYLLMNQEERGAVYSVSYVYAPLFEGDALAIATEKRIPLVLAGYSPGQPEPERMSYEFSRKLITETDWTPPGLKESGKFTNDELARFWNPRRYPPEIQFPRYLAPLHVWDYNQEEIIRKVHELGLVKKRAHASPIHSNYPINWLLMYSDLKHFGYNPYAPEFSALIRQGKANKLYWRFMMPIVNFIIKNKLLLGRNVTQQMKWLDLEESDLRITEPRGKYDPKLE